MSAWSGSWFDPSIINNGNEYAGGDGVYFSDLNIIANDLIYLKNDIDSNYVQKTDYASSSQAGVVK